MLKWGAYWTMLGILKLFGIGIANSKFQGHSWTKKYIKSCGWCYLLMGIPFIVLGLLDSYGIYTASILERLLVGVPSFICAILIDNKYRKLAKEE